MRMWAISWCRPTARPFGPPSPRPRGESVLALSRAYCLGGFVFVTTTSPLGFVSTRTGCAVVMVVGVLTAAVARALVREVVAFDVAAFVVLAELVLLVGVGVAVASADCAGTLAIVAFDVPAIAAFDGVAMAEFVDAAIAAFDMVGIAALVAAAVVAALVAAVVAIIAAVAGPMAKAPPPPTGPPVIPGPMTADDTDEFTVLCGLTTSAGLTNCPVGGVGALLCPPSGFTVPSTRPWYA